ncbi:hypothetical protein BD410DRAFT_810605, partial [Rickenella mellea]
MYRMVLLRRSLAGFGVVGRSDGERQGGTGRGGSDGEVVMVGQQVQKKLATFRTSYYWATRDSVVGLLWPIAEPRECGVKMYVTRTNFFLRARGGGYDAGGGRRRRAGGGDGGGGDAGGGDAGGGDAGGGDCGGDRLAVEVMLAVMLAAKTAVESGWRSSGGERLAVGEAIERRRWREAGGGDGGEERLAVEAAVETAGGGVVGRGGLQSAGMERHNGERACGVDGVAEDKAER